MNKLCVKIIGIENGYLIFEDSGNNSPYFSKKWQAKDREDLGELVERLAAETETDDDDQI